jgi:hypothetical protein
VTADECIGLLRKRGLTPVRGTENRDRWILIGRDGQTTVGFPNPRRMTPEERERAFGHLRTLDNSASD